MSRKLNLEKRTKKFLFKEWHCHLVKCVRGRLFSFQSRTGESPWLRLPRSNNYTYPSAFLKFYFHGNIPFTDLLPFAPETPFYPLFFSVVKSFCNRLKRKGAEGSHSSGSLQPLLCGITTVSPRSASPCGRQDLCLSSLKAFLGMKILL